MSLCTSTYGTSIIIHIRRGGFWLFAQSKCLVRGKTRIPISVKNRWPLRPEKIPRSIDKKNPFAFGARNFFIPKNRSQNFLHNNLIWIIFQPMSLAAKHTHLRLKYFFKRITLLNSINFYQIKLCQMSFSVRSKGNNLDSNSVNVFYNWGIVFTYVCT